MEVCENEEAVLLEESGDENGESVPLENCDEKALLSDEKLDDYFVAYEDLSVHELMIADTVRVKAYMEAIASAKSFITNKVVMDVGAGSGILSIFCAKHGAKKVYAVEASGLALLARKIIEENELADIIEVIQAPVEEVELPDHEKVDVIISEWMGFYLLHEAMLDSVIAARDKHLKSDGIMLPMTAVLYACPCTVPSEFDFWENVYGINMSDLGKAIRKARPLLVTKEVSKGQLLSEPNAVIQLDLYTVKRADLLDITSKCVSVITSAGRHQGMCLWFDCKFPNFIEKNEPIVLSTSPASPSTHWKQTVIVFEDSSVVEKDEPVAWQLRLKRTNNRSYDLTFEMLDPEEAVHPVPCSCYMTKCIVVRTILETELEPVDDNMCITENAETSALEGDPM